MGFENDQGGKSPESRYIQLAEGYGDLFGSPVLDYRMAMPVFSSETKPQTPSSAIDSVPLTAKDMCSMMPFTTTEADSLASMALGDSLLDRLYEIAVKSPQGIVTQKDFPSVYGNAAAAKLVHEGIMQITRKGAEEAVELAQPLSFGDDKVKVNIDSSVSFSVSESGGGATIDKLNGVTASSGIFSVQVNSLEMEPRTNGYLTATVSAGYMADSGSAAGKELRAAQPHKPDVVKSLCVYPNGKIYH